MLLILCSKRMASSVIFTNIHWAPKSMPCTSNTKSNQTSSYPDAANRVSREQTSKQAWHFSTVTAQIERGGHRDLRDLWKVGEAGAKECLLKKEMSACLFSTYHVREEKARSLPSRPLLSSREDKTRTQSTWQSSVYWRCYVSAWDGAASGSLVMRDNVQLFKLRFTTESPAPATPQVLGSLWKVGWL